MDFKRARHGCHSKINCGRFLSLTCENGHFCQNISFSRIYQIKSKKFMKTTSLIRLIRLIWFQIGLCWKLINAIHVCLILKKWNEKGKIKFEKEYQRFKSHKSQGTTWFYYEYQNKCGFKCQERTFMNIFWMKSSVHVRLFGRYCCKYDSL